VAEGGLTLACEPDLGGVPTGFQILTEGMSTTEMSSLFSIAMCVRNLLRGCPGPYAE
jgi:hypothetical protein